MNKKLITLLGMVALSCASVQAQTDADFRKQFEEAKKKWTEEFRNFREKCNREYADFIRQNWGEQEMEAPRVMPEEEKPVPPDFLPEEDRDLVLQDELMPLHNVVPYVAPKPQPQPIEPIEEVPAIEEIPVIEEVPVIEEKVSGFTFTFKGTTAKVRLSDENRFKLNDCSEESVANVWEKCAGVEFDNAVYDCLHLRDQYQLCDWAYLDMLKELGYAFFGKGTNEATLLTAFLFCQSGYKMRMARSDKNRLYLLYTSEHYIYGQNYFVVGSDCYYPVDCNEEMNLQICRAAFPKEQPMSLFVNKMPRYDVTKSKPRTLQSSRYNDVKATVSVNKNLIAFYDSYPRTGSELNDNFMTRWAIYANTPLAEDVKTELYPVLQRVVEGLSEKDAVDRLLNLVQTGLEYEYDDKVWGGDRAFFAEESLFYPYADCEDRSILLSRLVRDLLGLKVVLVYYPGHLATAVCFNEEVSGDYIQAEGRKFVVCDPTYIGGTVGRSMPSCRNLETSVILLE